MPAKPCRGEESLRRLMEDCAMQETISLFREPSSTSPWKTGDECTFRDPTKVADIGCEQLPLALPSIPRRFLIPQTHLSIICG